MRKFEVIDIVGVSTDTFTDAIRNAVKQGQERTGKIESIQVGPPWEIVVTDDDELEFRTTVRITYSHPR
jgi:flavin-binding protein dodecin